MFIAYDLLLYIVRAVAYEVSYFGGRARGRQKPRAPSLAERPSGKARTFSIGGPVTSGREGEERQRPLWRPQETNIQANIGAVFDN